ncbi:trypsin delta-like isoform X3 [Onthophagus taurus]|uniref:trypsin delta-like isoform X3 n=1 Tax=Onthophagus taurus TaxID=166361 RepID=UPI000C20E404|nr:trypsin delta-like [Onthophagus taurus]
MKTIILLGMLISAITCNVVNTESNDAAPSLEKNRFLTRMPFISFVSTTVDKHPYQASIQYSGRHICSGAIISSQYILTTAQCVDRRSLDLLSVRVGTTEYNRGGRTVLVSSIEINPAYNARTNDYDISILKLASSLAFSTTIKSIDMIAADEDVEPMTEVIAIGWNSATHDDMSSNELVIVSEKECRRLYGLNAITPNMICAGGGNDGLSGGEDTCLIEPGTNLILEKTTKDSAGVTSVKPILIGLAAWGYGCTRSQYPYVYTSISSNREFIRKTIS